MYHGSQAALPDDLCRQPRAPKRNPVSGWRRYLSFAGPAFLVSVGYMDPGNWGTDLAGGSRYGYALLWVILLSNLMAQFLQVLCVRLGLVTGRDLASACRHYYSRPVSFLLWLLCEVAIIACDLAELLGAAIALQLLFGLPLIAGVLITGLDVLLILALTGSGFSKIEAVVLTLVATIFLCFVYEIALADPSWGLVAHGMLVPSIPDLDALFISLGILGATVMPHNLYLHSSLVQSRGRGSTDQELSEAIRYNTIDTVIALSFAFLVNAAILILAAAEFWSVGVVVEELAQGHELLKHTLGAASASVFALALLASGQSSTITGTLAGQIVMEGFLQIRLRPWVRRSITRGLAILPAIWFIWHNDGKNTVELLILSQIVLSMQLPFAIFPLIALTSDRAEMGKYANPRFTRLLGYLIALAISALNLSLLYTSLGHSTFLFIVIATAGLFGGAAILGHRTLQHRRV